MDIITKAVTATIENTGAATDFPGTFEVELTNPNLDRDGDELHGNEWQTPLPDRITFVNDHTHKMAAVVGSAKPTLDGEKIICSGEWAETDEAQNTRKAVKHAPYVSVAYREKRSDGKVSRELINGSFVVVPANPTARVLSSKGFEPGLDDETKDFIREILKEADIAVAGKAYLPAGFKAYSVFESGEQVLEIKADDGTVILSHKFQAPDVPLADEATAASADQEKEKALALADAATFGFSANHLL